EATKCEARVERIAGILGVPSRWSNGEGHVDIEGLEHIDVGLPGVGEDGMPGRNEQRKPGTARGSPRRSRTAKASRISRFAVKSRCTREWGGWGRLSDEGPDSINRTGARAPGAEGKHPPWRRKVESSPRHSAGSSVDHEVREGRRQTRHCSVHAGSRLKLTMFWKGPPEMPAFQPYRGKPAVRNVRGDRGNTGIIRSPVRASILPDQVPTHRPKDHVSREMTASELILDLVHRRHPAPWHQS